jgi:uncharacterized membrane protein YuzA (DUF378 family)
MAKGKKNKKGKGRKRNGDASLAELVGFSLVAIVLPGLAVGVVSVVVRDLVGGWVGAVLLVPAILGFGYAVMGLGGAVMFAFFFALDETLSKDDERPMKAMGVALIVVLFLTIPLSAVLLGFDRDQWAWGVGSAAVGLAIALYALVVLPRRERSAADERRSRRRG